MDEVEQPIMRMFEAYKAAVFAKDIDACVNLYGRDVCVFDLWGTWSYNGIDAWRGMVAEWFGSLGAGRVVVEVDDVQAIVAHDLAIAHAIVTYRGESAEGSELHSMQNRLTWALKQEGGAWKIVHEHTSAPVDHETSKVMLRRQLRAPT